MAAPPQGRLWNGFSLLSVLRETLSMAQSIFRPPELAAQAGDVFEPEQPRIGTKSFTN